jgi:hypothetical protein
MNRPEDPGGDPLDGMHSIEPILEVLDMQQVVHPKEQFGQIERLGEEIANSVRP